MGKRVLGATRLSVASDESVSTPVQRDKINGWARLHEHEVVGVTDDEDVSGKVSPFARAGLGPWLTDPDKIASWDILCVAKLDRASRSIAHFVQLTDWLKAHGKSFASVAEDFNLDTPAGRMVAQLLAVFAEFERERIGERQRDARARMRKEGKWTGRFSYGYQRQGTALAKDPDRAATVVRMVDMAIGGMSYGQIAQRLAAEQVPTINGGKWLGTTVRAILLSPSLVGWMEHKPSKDAEPQIVRDDSGLPVMFADDPILTEERWHQLQRALKTRSKPTGARVRGYQLLRVAYCRQCSAPLDLESPRPGDVPLYGKPMAGRGYGYYHCRRCGFHTRTDALERWVEQHVRNLIGSAQLPRKVVIPGDDHSVVIRKMERDIETMRGVSQSPAVKAAISAMEAELAGLQAMPHEPDRIEWDYAVETIAKHLDSLDYEGKGNFYRRWRMSVYADRDGSEAFLGDLGVGEVYRQQSESPQIPEQSF